ncbi:hypothetical protein [Streptomyces sp. NPDC097619]|uniref:hypothetical protein n=1 Tax=Streptomyces sp. NPDC097619 TaxID=3157228 RepID=UPI00332A24C9
MKVRTIPLTHRWHLMAWRGGSRLAIGPVRTHDAGRARTIGATLSLARLTVGLLCQTREESRTTTDRHWYRDYGRFSIGGWHNSERTIPVSTGWMTVGVGRRAGASLTMASHTFYVVRMFTRAEYRTYRRERDLYGRILRPYDGRGRKRRSG